MNGYTTHRLDERECVLWRESGLDTVGRHPTAYVGRRHEAAGKEGAPAATAARSSP